MTDSPRVPYNRQFIVSWEDIADFNVFSNTIQARLAPVGILEEFFAERIVSSSWRIKRAQYMQKAAIEYLKAVEVAKMKARAGEQPAETGQPAREPATRNDDDAVLVQMMSDPTNARIIENLLKYEKRFHDSVRRNTKELLRLQRLRKREAAKGSAAAEDSMDDWPTLDQFPDLSGSE